MKKTLQKLIGTVLAIVITVFFAIYLWEHFNIEPRMFFFGCFAVSIIEFFAIVYIFLEELEKIKEFFTSGRFEVAIQDTIQDKSTKMSLKKAEREKVRSNKAQKFIYNIADNPIFILGTFIFTVISFVLTWYMLFFGDDIRNNAVFIFIFLGIIAVTFCCYLVKGIKDKKHIPNACIWGFVLLIQSLNCFI